VSSPDPPTAGELAVAAALIERWMDAQRSDNPAVAHVEADSSGEQRWFVRLHGEEKDVFSVWFHLRQRSLWVETHFMPAPIVNLAETYEHLLRRNRKLVGFSFVIGDEDAVYLRGSVPVSEIDDDQLDRLLGSAFEYTETCFRPAMRLGYGAAFGG